MIRITIKAGVSTDGTGDQAGRTIDITDKKDLDAIAAWIGNAREKGGPTVGAIVDWLADTVIDGTIESVVAAHGGD